MSMQYTIVGGYLCIQKNVFFQELLLKDSLLRALLNWKTTKDFSIKHPLVSDPDGDGNIIMRFSSETSVDVDEPIRDLFNALKKKYREKIKGRISCRVIYSAYGGIFTYDLDLNSDGDQAEYIMN